MQMMQPNWTYYIAQVVQLLFTLGLLAGFVFFVIAAWRGMKAHESMAESMKQLAAARSAVQPPKEEISE